VKRLLLILFLITVIISGCTNESGKKTSKTKERPKYQECSEEGYIISKNDDSIWVISTIEKDDIKNKTEKELNELFRFKGVVFDIQNISKETKTRLEEKQKVKVYCNEILKESAPSQGEAIKIEVLEE
jgi:NhaP-type Na+/H+ and K+/H+ antiporter